MASSIAAWISLVTASGRLAAGFFGSRLSEDEQVGGSSDGAALGMAEHDDQLGASDFAGVLQAPQDAVAHNVASDSDAKDVAHAEVENQLRRCSRINAGKNSGHRERLPRRMPASRLRLKRGVSGRSRGTAHSHL